MKHFVVGYDRFILQRTADMRDLPRKLRTDEFVVNETALELKCSVLAELSLSISCREILV